MPENLLSIQQYAVKNKLSTFAVIKLVNSGKLKTVKKEVDGNEQEFIIDESAPIEHISQPYPHTSEQTRAVNYEAEFHKLLAKYIELQEKYTQLIEEKYHATK